MKGDNYTMISGDRRLYEIIQRGIAMVENFRIDFKDTMKLQAFIELIDKFLS